MFTETVALSMPSHPCRVRVAHPDGPGPWPAIGIFMDGFGYRQALFDMQERLAGHGYTVLLPDLFYFDPAFDLGEARKALMDATLRPAFVARYIRPAIQTEGFEALLTALLAHIAQRSDVAPGGMGVTGYCMGGGLALKAAGLAPEHVKAAASFHGGNLATDAPDSPHTYAPRMKARLYIGGADQDLSFPEAMKARLNDALLAAGASFTLETYAGAIHGWTLPDLPIYQPEAAERHWRELVRLMDGALKPVS